jgi:glutamine synthetase
MTDVEPLAAAAMRGGAGAGDGEFVLLGIPDVNGSIRGKALRPAAFESAVREGTVVTDLLLALDPTDAPITDYEQFGIRSGAGDIVVRPEPETLRELSWRLGWRVCLATLYWTDGRLCELASREVLRSALASLRELGHETLAAFEYEIRIRDADGKPLSSGISYSVGEVMRFDELVTRLAPALDALGVELSAVHTEAGPGLLELNVAARPGLQAADDAALLKLAVKEVAASLGMTASFLAKTVAGEEGSSGHVHLSCWQDDTNAFAADEATLDAAVAGILDHLPAASLLLNPTINSYKRLVPGYFAPVNASWGIENRSAALRVIRPDRAERARIECRRPGADANPYLALAALAASAADGIRRGATPPAPVEGDASERPDLPPLPNSLEEALRAFEEDADFRAALGDTFADYYAVSRRWELKAWQDSVSDWERARYERAV